MERENSSACLVVCPPYRYTIEPAAPRPGEVVRMRIDSEDGCFEGITAVLVKVENRELRFGASFNDYGQPGCPQPTPAYVTIGALPRGTYTLYVDECISNPIPPTPQCITTSVRTLLVGGGDPVAVPAVGIVATISLAALLLAVTAVRTAAHR